MPSGETKFFVSYARKGAQFALKLAKDLREAGANLWVDQLNIRVGDKWDRTVQQALKTCEGMLVVLSPEAVEIRRRLLPVESRESHQFLALG